MSAPERKTHIGEVNSANFNTANLTEEEREIVKKFKDSEIADFPVDLEQIKFFVKSGLVHSIAFFMNSTDRGKDLHKLRKAQNGDALVKFEGRLVSVTEVMQTIKFSDEKGRFVSIDDETRDWNYISPNGFIQKSSFDYDHLYPIEEIGHAEFEKLLAHAHTFWEKHEEVNPGIKKPCVLQIVTTNRQHSDNKLNDSLLKAYPEHVTFRLFKPDGRVYSFGLQMEPSEENEIFNERFPRTFAKTTTSRITEPDYEERRECHSKRATSIPVTDTRLQAIIQLVEKHNSEGLSFNFFHQNCATVAREILKIAGIDVKVRASIRQVLIMSLPELEVIPRVGPTLNTVARNTEMVVRAIDHAIPKCLQHDLAFLAQPVTLSLKAAYFVVSKVATIMLNPLVIKLDGNKRSTKTPPPPENEDKLNNRNGLTRFSKLVRKWSDLFTEELCSIDFHLCLINWQMKQSSTYVHKSDGKTKLHYLPAE